MKKRLLKKRMKQTLALVSEDHWWVVCDICRERGWKPPKKLLED